ncbi:hypothetical protein DICSQDRAFT_166025 [Dichomitus squalens LYAD-421 SS1]|uniref:uncharacterized protein n=1 Tax=Dichomitus squalens (strain LYAD-421) TaxID=732165 RepID=UPI00044144D8|nr:uncharacterized protein DICSQDRAFT_166025 [Dichomitus squalens LYAD-421 SS1]EJF66329.1 hypothetical protein DICSQDRAFT_166025 [Dichomitus squalens LYAD-421 SS1]
MPPRPTIKDLQAQVAILTEKLEKAQAAEAQDKIQEQAIALAAAIERAVAATTVGPGIVPVDAENPGPTIERPKTKAGGRIAIQDEMGLKDKDELFRNIQTYIRSLVPTCGIDWKKNFRIQSADNLSKLYRAARKEYPILKRYKNDWATAELLKMYLQNAREHARIRGYIPRAGRKSSQSNNGNGGDNNTGTRAPSAAGGSTRRGRGRAARA